MQQLSLFYNLDKAEKTPPGKRMEDNSIKRLYYSIAQVSKITGLKQYVLRYWETEFTELKPAKNRAGKRIYKEKDIKIIFLIKRLLYQEKYTIEGARKRLRNIKRNKDTHQQLSLLELEKIDVLEQVKNELKELLDILDNKK